MRHDHTEVRNKLQSQIEYVMLPQELDPIFAFRGEVNWETAKGPGHMDSFNFVAFWDGDRCLLDI